MYIQCFCYFDKNWKAQFRISSFYVAHVRDRYI